MKFHYLTYFSFIFFLFPCHGNDIADANHYYVQGEQTNSYHERTLAFNNALNIYHSLEDSPNHPPYLEQALADTYYQLEEYAWAILYYHRAIKKNGFNEDLAKHLDLAYQKLGLRRTLDKHSVNTLLFDLGQNYKVIFISIIIVFFTLSISIWYPLPWPRRIARFCSVFLLILLGNVLFIYYTSPVEGILIKPTGFYRAADWHQPQLRQFPLLAGSKVKILKMVKEGSWLKIEESDQVGYIPTDQIRII